MNPASKIHEYQAISSDIISQGKRNYFFQYVPKILLKEIAADPEDEAMQVFEAGPCKTQATGFFVVTL